MFDRKMHKHIRRNTQTRRFESYAYVLEKNSVGILRINLDYLTLKKRVLNTSKTSVTLYIPHRGTTQEPSSSPTPL